jgi:heptosyltransferase II
MAFKSIFIVGPAWVGDMVMSQSLFKLLKQHYPEATIDVLAPEWSQGLLECMPEVRKSILSPFKHGELRLRDRYRLAKELRTQQYDWAIVLPNSFKSALIPFWAKIPKRSGWGREGRGILLNDARRLDEKKYPLMIERFMALGLPESAELPLEPQWPSLQLAPGLVEKTLSQLQIVKPSQPILALCPGAEFGISKRWPPGYYAQVAKAKLDEGWVVWLFGSKRDGEVAEDIQHKTQRRCLDLTGKTQLAEAIALLSLAKAVVSNDSGLMHIAAALQRPLVAIYGSSSALYTPPLSNNVQILSLNLECSPCFQRVCPLGHFKCMLDLQPRQVLETLDLLV